MIGRGTRLWWASGPSGYFGTVMIEPQTQIADTTGMRSDVGTFRRSQRPLHEITSGEVIYLHISGEWKLARIEYDHAARAYVSVDDYPARLNGVADRLAGGRRLTAVAAVVAHDRGAVPVFRRTAT
jgi:hypothetical protein